MRIGISVSSAQPLAANDHRSGARWIVDRARAAARAGLDTLSLGDQHATGIPYYQNTPMLGRLTAEWPDRPIGCLFLVPLWHPVLMAEQIATLANLTEARFIVQTAVGGGSAHFAAMGSPMSERGARLEEGIALVSALLDGQTVSSERWAISEASISPLPPTPVEWWIGGGVDAALDRAARLGHAWYAGPELSATTAAAPLATYLERCEHHGRTPDRIIIRKDVIVTADGSDATRLGDQLIEQGYRGHTRDAVAYGSPEEVAAQLAPFRELGFTDIVARSMFVPQPIAVETVELLGEVKRLLAG